MSPAPAPNLDEGTWNQFAQGDLPTPPVHSPRPKDGADGSAAPPAPEAPNTVPAAHPTPTPFPTAGGGDSAEKDSGDQDSGDKDSGASTPKPSREQSDEWDLLPAPTIEMGRMIFGKYLLEEKLGEGGMGQVWRVENVPLQRESALKLIKPGIAQNDKGWRRFEREARLMAKITHPNAVGVYDFRRTHSMGYIEMELVPGVSLHDFLKRRKGEPMPLDWIAQFLDQLCSVLQVAHGHVDKKTGKARPIIHRDLKPSNLMLAEGKPPGQDLKVLDFGIAKVAEDEGSPELTGVGDFLGTPDYMSPEQIRGGITKEGKGDIDGRSDLYSVGVILYQLLTGSLPFQAMSRMAVLGAHLHGTPMPMKEANPAARLPPQVERLVMRCLEKDPDQRPQTAGELADQFRKALAGLAPETEKPRRTIPLIPLTAVCVLVAGLIIAAPRLRDLGRSGTAKSNSPPMAGKADKGKAGTPGKSEDATGEPHHKEGGSATKIAFWLPKDYEAAEPYEAAADVPDEAMRLRRTSDNVEFYRFKQGMYLPVGYEPESHNMDDLTDGDWPRVIIRTWDKKVRFIRIPAKKYIRGDVRRPAALDSKGNPCSPHPVRVSGFYIQETEVTNGEIENYIDAHPEAANHLRTWRRYNNDLRKKIGAADTAKRYPAVCISYLAAKKYAQDVGGRLPREAEWECAAKSGNDKSLFPWPGENAGKGAKLKANLFNVNIASTSFGPVEVMKFFPEDKTAQNVFDMAGNVRELCLDVYQPYSKLIKAHNSTTDPMVDPWVREEPRPDTPAVYVVRGGWFGATPQQAMVFQRSQVPADDPEPPNNTGFRVVIECPPARPSSY
jgi:serine/threonine-protein kinase